MSALAEYRSLVALWETIELLALKLVPKYFWQPLPRADFGLGTFCLLFAGLSRK